MNAAVDAKTEEFVANKMLIYHSARRIKRAREIPGGNNVLILENAYQTAEHEVQSLMKKTNDDAKNGQGPKDIQGVMERMLVVSQKMSERDEKREAVKKAWSELGKTDEKIAELNAKYDQTNKRYIDAVEAVRQAGGQSGGFLTGCKIKIRMENE